MKWIHKPQEVEGDWMFQGDSYMTRAVKEKLGLDDVVIIASILKDFVATQKGADYLQVFERDDGLVVWCIDDRKYWTMLLPSDY